MSSEAPHVLAVSAFATLFVLSGCGQIEEWRHPELSVCEDYTKTTLKAPSTYQRVKATLTDSRLPLEYWQERSNDIMPGLAGEDEYHRTNALKGGVRSLLIEYDVSNGFGVPVRGLSLCKFEMSSISDNKFTFKPSADRLSSAIGVGEVSEIPCCEYKQIMDRLMKFEAKEQYISQQVLN